MSNKGKLLLLSTASANAGEEIPMKCRRFLFSFIGLCAASLLFNLQASAQCGAVAKHVSYPMAQNAGHFQLAGAAQDSGEPALDPIVGLWKMDFEDQAAKYSDRGYSVWHSDHTEFMNSTRTPAVGAVCQGVWTKVSGSTYRLNHFALGYADGVNLTSVYQFQLLVTMNGSGNGFYGTFSIEAFNPKTHAPQGTLKGTVTGERVTIDTTIDSQYF